MSCSVGRSRQKPSQNGNVGPHREEMRIHQSTVRSGSIELSKTEL